MKAEIKASGVLKISAENELEAYALRQWANENILDTSMGSTMPSDHIIIDSAFPLNPDAALYQQLMGNLQSHVPMQKGAA
jgi:protein-L-isoaspartate O-methyltransferase